VNIVFWNLNKKPLLNEIQSLCQEYNVDLLILAENEIPISELLKKVNENSSLTYVHVKEYIKNNTLFTIITRFKSRSIRPILDENRASIKLIKHPLGIELILVCVHLPSKLHSSDVDQAAVSTRLGAMINKIEEKYDNKNTIVIGDFNMNPFETGLASCDAFHGIMDRSIALKGNRTVQGKKRHFFYNPMWSRLGDNSPGPPGTYYYSNSGFVNYFWHTFDQVLLRPDLLDYFDDENLEIISHIGNISLLSENTGISHNYSDHLPIYLKLNLERSINYGKQESMG
jgi:exonuclease III